MPTLTGSLSDIGLAPLVGQATKIELSPSVAAVDGNGRVFASKPVEVTPNAAGGFSVDLASTTNLRPQGAHWVMRLIWRVNGSHMGWDFPPFKLHIGQDDLSLADAIQGDPSAWAQLLHVGVNPPSEERSVVAWIDTSGETAVVKRWENE